MATLNFEVKDTRTFKQKVEAFGYDVKNKAKKAGRWIVENPAQAAMIGAGIVGGIAEVRRCGDRISDAHEKAVGRRTMYCNDVQSYVRLKHEPKGAELIELRNLMNQGNTKFEALMKMGLVK